MSIKFSLTFSAQYATDAPTLEVLLGGSVLFSELVTTVTGSGVVTVTYDIPYAGSLADLNFRFNDASSESGRSITVENVRINGQTIDPNAFSLSGGAAVTGGAVALNGNGAGSLVNGAIADYLLGVNEPSLAELGTVTVAGTTGNDTAIVGTAGDDVINADAGHDTVSAGAGDDIIYGGDGIDTIYGHDGNDLIVGGGDNDRLYGRNDDDLIYGGEGADRIYGDDGDDVLNGGAGNDKIYGGAGNDRIYGGDDHDLIQGDAGNDIIDGGSGDDDIRGGEGDDTINGDAGRDTLLGEDGNDTLSGGDDSDFIQGGAGEDILNGDAGNDTIYGGDDNDTIDGGIGDDILRGQEGDDTVSGDDGNDWLYGENGNDTLNGGAGRDRLFGDAGDDIINGGDDVDRVEGGEGNDTLNGDGGNDFVDGGVGDDIIDGGAGADRLFGGEGNDVINGGDGNDVLYASLEGVYQDAVTIADILASDSEISYNAATGNFYKYVRSETGAVDVTHGAAVADAASNFLNGFAAHLATITSAAEQTFVGGIVNGSQWAWVDGSDVDSEGNFVYESGPEAGTSFSTALSWNGGDVSNTNTDARDNVLIWDGGGDVLFAFDGDAYGYVAEWEGSDVITPIIQSGFDSRGETNTLNGGAGHDTLHGSLGDDILDGGSGNDILNGGYGDDTASYESATNGVRVNLSTGLALNHGTDILNSIENVTGGDFNDNITGDTGDNVLHGGAGDDRILGGNGNDTIFGGDGSDVIGSLVLSNDITVADVLALDDSLNYNAATGNFYKFVSTTSTWTDANAAAQADILFDTAGHLVDINSAAEHAYVSSIVDSGAHFWSGGSDSAVEGQWQWSDGTVFWDSGASTGEYTDWFNGSDTSNRDDYDNLIILNGDNFSNQFYAFTGTGFSAAYLIEWEGASVLDYSLAVNTTTDVTTISGGNGQDRLYGGQGIDIFVFEAATDYSLVDRIHNFVTGTDGDALDISDLLTDTSGDITEYIQFVDSGPNDTLVQVDRDGAGTDHGFENIAKIFDLNGLDEVTLHTDGNIII